VRLVCGTRSPRFLGSDILQRQARHEKPVLPI
jgi:hypothetical protein